MNDDNQKQMYQGDWTCVGCGASIKELPFEPRSTENLRCRDCHQQKRDVQGGAKQMHEGNWQCSQCGNAINKLPFEPKNTDNLLCIDCFKKSKGV